MKIFGTDGVRGKANSAPMTPEVALALGKGAGYLLRKRSPKPRVVIGKDTRLSCYVFENALIAGLCSMGVDTLMVGPLPTPGVAFITRAYRADAGIVISASHNPYYDNGIKFFDADGFKFPDAWEEELEGLIAHSFPPEALPKEDEIGKNTKISDADGRYIEFAKATFPRGKSLRNLKIALDCANGAAYRVAPLVLRELDATVFSYGVTPNGLNINQKCGSTHPALIQKAVIEHGADVGIALDGDGDRIVMVDENAQVLDGDTILAICARDMQQRGILRNNQVVATVMSNLGFIRAMEELGIQVVQAAVGDRYVLQEMLRVDAALGGEQSGHVIFRDHNTTGDGIVCALQVLDILLRSDLTLSALASFVQKCPQLCLNVPVRYKPPLDTLQHLQHEIEAAKTALGSSGRVLVRYSGTENICRVMVEGLNYKEVHRLAHQIVAGVQKELGARA